MRSMETYIHEDDNLWIHLAINRRGYFIQSHYKVSFARMMFVRGINLNSINLTKQLALNSSAEQIDILISRRLIRTELAILELIKHEHVEKVLYLFEKIPITESMIQRAVDYPNDTILAFLTGRGYPLPRSRFEILTRDRDGKIDNCNENIFSTHNCDHHWTAFVLQNEFAYKKNILLNALSTNNKTVIKYYGKIRDLDYAMVIFKAVVYNNFAFVKKNKKLILWANGFVEYFMLAGNLKALEFLRKKITDQLVIRNYIKSVPNFAFIDIMEWAINHNLYEFDQKTMNQAAAHGLHVLKYCYCKYGAHEITSFKNEDMEVIIWAYNNKLCTLATILKSASKHKFIRVFNWIENSFKYEKNDDFVYF